MEQNNTRKKTSKSAGLKSSTLNLILNVSIFLLAAIIIYMGYSIYLKLANNKHIKDDQFTEQVASDIIQVEVLNGSGVNGVADRFTDFLRNNNLDVVKSGNYISDDVNESLVIDRSGNMANAFKTAKILGIKKENVIQQLNKDYFLDVSIIVGKDYFNLAPFK
ncbi:MAG: LytR C-terminal domain-containing protein [Ignavibacteriales bacterium]|nr:LytR C-terminal domain-containing protein [Ignavibacteriales bacterium]